MKRVDIAIIASGIAIAIILGAVTIINKDNYNKKYVEISVKGKILKKINLSDKNYKETIVIENELGKNEIRIFEGGVQIVEADCPDKLCVHTGFIDEPGEIVVCLPHKLVVEIKGKNEEIVDEKSY